MSHSTDTWPYFLRQSALQLVCGAKNKKTERKRETEDKKMSAEEAATAFQEVEIDLLRAQYTCLNVKPQELEDAINQEVIGQEEVVNKVVQLVYTNQLFNFAEELGYEVPERVNMILVGPTGCGKTSIIRSLKKHFKVPLARYASDSITSAGYIGNKVEDILLRLFEEAKQDQNLAERGIIFIDEIDKKREQESFDKKDINGRAVQEELLKILEPNTIDVPLGSRGKIHFDTTRLTVIMGGAFVGLDKIKEKRLKKRSLGFKNESEEMSDKEIAESEYIPQDFIDYGFIPEFVGRLLEVGVLRQLDEKDMLKIILYGKNSPYLERTKFLANVLNVEQIISRKLLENIAQELANCKTGARALRAKMISLFHPIYHDALENFGEEGICTIDEEGHYCLEYDDITYYG